MSPTPTRTLNPLPFEHLEPKRFEDLVRQLAYDFRPWRQLEATGRAGSDDGFDARGFEAVSFGGETADEIEEGEGDPPDAMPDRLWLVQCKRERSISPAKLKRHLEDIPPHSREGLYGLLFVAACDFSKAARDLFRTWCRDEGLAECHLWGKAELEDLLFQPKNDHLLFAYFGISLSIRRSSQRTAISRLLTTKRRVAKVLGTRATLKPVLLRDPTDDRYPYVDRKEPVRWLPMWYEGLTHQGLKLVWRTFHAYLDDDGTRWDAANAVNHHRFGRYNGDPWQVWETDEDLAREVRTWWQELPDHDRAWFTLYGFLPLEKVIAIDDLGDDVVDVPQVYAFFENDAPPLASFNASLNSVAGFEAIDPERADRIEHFPSHMRKRLWEGDPTVADGEHE